MIPWWYLCGCSLSLSILTFYFVRFFYEERRNKLSEILLFIYFIQPPKIYQVQKLYPGNSNDVKKITQFIDIIMKIFEPRNDWDISFDWYTVIFDWWIFTWSVKMPLDVYFVDI